MVGLQPHLGLPSLGWASRGQVADSLVQAGDWTTGVRVPPLLCPDSALVAMGAFPMVRTLLGQAWGRTSRRERGRETGRICLGPRRATGTLTPMERTKALPVGVRHTGQSARRRERPGDWAAQMSSPAGLCGAAGNMFSRYVRTLTCASAQSCSRVFKRLSSHRCSHPRSHTLTCAPR